MTCRAVGPYLTASHSALQVYKDWYFKMEKYLITKGNNLFVGLLEGNNVLAKGITVKYAYAGLVRGDHM